LKILQIHNQYQHRTGEETVVEEEKNILERNGHQVIQFLKKNDQINAESVFRKAKILFNLRYSHQVEEELKELILNEKPSLCHVHNTFPIITPGIFRLCHELQVPVVKTLHNYKMICTKSTLFRKGEVCTRCLNRSMYHAISFRCYRNSFLATAFQADVIQHHRQEGTWSKYVDRFLALTEFQKDLIVVGGGLPADKVTVKPNFLSSKPELSSFEDFLLFVGKVDDYKGQDDLLYLAEKNSQTRIVVIGEAREGLFDDFQNVEYLGYQTKAIVMDYLRRCKAVLFPSRNFEGMPMVIIEAFSVGKAVICRNIGAMSTMITDGINGVHYNTLEELSLRISELEGEPQLLRRLGINALNDYKKRYSEKVGYRNLMNVYRELLADKQISLD